MKALNLKVLEAKLKGDREQLQELSKKGAAAKRADKRIREARVLAGVYEKLQQGNEDLCPVD